MNYFLFKLQFDTAVHFGGADSALSLYTSEETLRADTLFSALCHETLVQHGEEALEQLCAQVRQGKFLLIVGAKTFRLLVRGKMTFMQASGVAVEFQHRDPG